MPEIFICFIYCISQASRRMLGCMRYSINKRLNGWMDEFPYIAWGYWTSRLGVANIWKWWGCRQMIQGCDGDQLLEIHSVSFFMMINGHISMYNLKYTREYKNMWTSQGEKGYKLNLCLTSLTKFFFHKIIVALLCAYRQKLSYTNCNSVFSLCKISYNSFISVTGDLFTWYVCHMQIPVLGLSVPLEIWYPSLHLSH